MLLRRNDWRPEEIEPLLEAFGDDVELELLRRSPRDPRVLIVWVGWDRLPPSIFLVTFQELTATGTPVRHEFMSVGEIFSSAWGHYFPDESASQNETGSPG